MKIYFNASLTGKDKYLKEFQTIIKTVEGFGHEVYSEHVMKRNPENVNEQTRRQHEIDFQKTRDSIQRSDCMIVEATYPSIGVGHIMTIALEMHKSVLVLYQGTPHGLLIGDPSRLLVLRKYSLKNMQELKNSIEDFLKKANKRLLNKRFNFMIDEMEEEYLDWASIKKGVSKADYLRQLIDDDLKKNKEYVQYS